MALFDLSTFDFKRWQRWLLVYLLALGLVAGPAYTMYVHYDFSHSLDTRSYLSVARGEFEGVSITRRYRVLVPLVAATVAWPLEQVYAHIWPHRATSDWPLRLGFYVVNCLLMAGFGAVLFRICLGYGASPPAAALAVVAVLVSRWAVYIAGLPMVDSLYLLVFALAVYAARVGSGAALIIVLLVGPLAKESFVFLIPWLALYARRVLGVPVQLGWLAAGAGAALGLRYWIDNQAGTPPAESFHNAVNHIENLRYSLDRLFSVKGFGEIFSIFGFFSLVLVAGLFSRSTRQTAFYPLGLPALMLLVVVAVHMLLSGELARMGYLASPIFAAALSLVLTHHPAISWLATGQDDEAKLST